MFRRFFYQLRTHRLASQIRQIRPDLRPLTDELVIDQYLSDWLTNRQAAADLNKAHPMSPLYERVLLHKGCGPKAVYIELAYRFERICQAQAEVIQTNAETSEAMRDYEEQLLSTADNLVQMLASQQASQQITSPIRQN